MLTNFLLQLLGRSPKQLDVVHLCVFAAAADGKLRRPEVAGLGCSTSGASCLSFFQGTYYLRLKAVQMVRILHLGPSYVSTTPGESALRGVSAWQRRRGSHGNDEDYRKESSPSSVVKSFYLSPTAVQMLVMILAIIIGFLQVFYVWGKPIVPDACSDMMMTLLIRKR